MIPQNCNLVISSFSTNTLTERREHIPSLLHTLWTGYQDQNVKGISFCIENIQYKIQQGNCLVHFFFFLLNKKWVSGVEIIWCPWCVIASSYKYTLLVANPCDARKNTKNIYKIYITLQLYLLDSNTLFLNYQIIKKINPLVFIAHI